MSFVHLSGDNTNKPTFFEVIAADRLVPSLKAAVVYTLSVLSQRQRWIYRLLEYDDEVFTAILLLLDWHSLSSSDATFSEALYGLRRVPLAAGVETPAGTLSPPLSRRQRLWSLVTHVLLPYLRSKSSKLYKLNAHRGVLGLALQAPAASPANEIPPASAAAAWRQKALHAFVKAYPFVHAGIEGVVFAYQALYLLTPSAIHHPLLHAAGLRMGRLSPEDMTASAKRKQAGRQALADQVSRTAPPSLRPLQLLMLRTRHLVADNIGSALILAVFSFKALEWWYGTAEDKLLAGQALPPPPPPPAPRPSPQGVGLPDDTSLCPVCRRVCTNPAQLASSGYVFCYPCVFRYVMERRRCPVSQLPASIDHVRKLYEAS